MLFILLSMYSAFAEEQTITFEDGSTYKGNVVNDEMEGKGLYKSAKDKAGRNLQYLGEFKGGKFNGEGQLDFYNGDIYSKINKL